MNAITIHNHIQHRIDDAVYAHFIEELGEGIHDGLWTYSERLKRLPHLSDPLLDGVREDLFAALRPLFHAPPRGRTLLRWPGGCFADSYHWKDGIGPRDQRVTRANGHWSRIPYRFIRSAHGVPGPACSNHFGTDEFLALCARLDASAYINVNYGTGTPEEAADWVEYVNGSEQTRWGRERAPVHRQPNAVHTWGIANEIWGRWELGYERSAAAYARRYLEFAKAMKARDPSIRLVACGLDPHERNPLVARDSATWNRTLLRAAADHIDFLSFHCYVPVNTAPWCQLRRSARYAHTEETYWAILATPNLIREALDRMWHDVADTLGADTRVRLAFDEWNVWYHFTQVIKANFTLMDGLWVGCMLHLLQALADRVGMANFAQLVNVIGLVRTDDDGIVVTPSYHVFRLLRQHAHPGFLKTEVDCGTYRNQYVLGIRPSDTSYLSCAATVSDSGEAITVSVVNRHFRESVQARLRFDGFHAAPRLRECVVLGHHNPFAMNTPEERDAVAPRRESIEGTPEQHTFPAHSLTVFTFLV